MNLGFEDKPRIWRQAYVTLKSKFKKKKLYEFKPELLITVFTWTNSMYCKAAKPIFLCD